MTAVYPRVWETNNIVHEILWLKWFEREDWVQGEKYTGHIWYNTAALQYSLFWLYHHHSQGNNTDSCKGLKGRICLVLATIVVSCYIHQLTSSSLCKTPHPIINTTHWSTTLLTGKLAKEQQSRAKKHWQFRFSKNYYYCLFFWPVWHQHTATQWQLLVSSSQVVVECIIR